MCINSYTHMCIYVYIHIHLKFPVGNVWFHYDYVIAKGVPTGYKVNSF